MKIITYTLPAILTALCLSSCSRGPSTIWEDTQSASRHMTRGLRALGGKHSDSRQINCRDEFITSEIVPCPVEEYIPLQDAQDQAGFDIKDIAPAREAPGEPGSSIPGIEYFQDPSTNPRWAGTFRTIHFPYNSTLIKGDENLQTLKGVAHYMKQYPRTYIFIEGHCDERGADAYNLSLGSHRANEVRNHLVNEGVNPDHIFVISYGKERPIIVGHDEESWYQNRRAEFRVFER
jgi:peptidoglycan-associated lipoprotein